jgi:phospholipid/cholesterol/gamma-HCH transport system substrate-binding protein
MRKLGALVVVVGILAAACSGGGGGKTISAKFDDVGDLTPGAPVMFQDISIGKVSSIDLAGNQALIEMSIDPDAHVPTNAIARVRRTSLLGERIVDLVAPEGTSSDVPDIRDGATIQNTEARPDLEDLVQSGTEVLAPIAASEVATLVNTGGEGFGGKGEVLGNLLKNFRAIVRTYKGQTGLIRSVVQSLDQFNATLAAQAGSQARSIANSARGLEMLREESDHLGDALHSLARLAVGARSILAAHLDEMSRFFNQMRVILGVVARHDGSLVRLLNWAPFHDRNTQLVDYQQFNQILQDFIICGMNDDPKDPARQCKGQA